MSLLIVFVFVFAFVSSFVAMCRAFDVIEQHNMTSRVDALRIRNITHYRGEYCNRHGRTIERAIQRTRFIA